MKLIDKVCFFPFLSLSLSIQILEWVYLELKLLHSRYMIIDLECGMNRKNGSGLFHAESIKLVPYN